MIIREGGIYHVKIHIERPDYWNRQGLMDEYMGKPLKIRSIEKVTWQGGEYKIYAENIEPWIFSLDDFEETPTVGLSLEDVIEEQVRKLRE